MPTQSEHFVIAVAGLSGAGKSTLVKELVQELEDAVGLYFDDYNPHLFPNSHYPEDQAQWLAEGAQPDCWSTPQMTTDLQALLRGETVKHHNGKHILEPARFIVLEEPFGRTRAAMKDLINYVILINTPLEVALARRLLREAEYSEYKEHPDKFGHSVFNYLSIYIDLARPMYLAVNEYVYKDCDLILDGLKSLPEMVNEAASQVRNASTLSPS